MKRLEVGKSNKVKLLPLLDLVLALHGVLLYSDGGRIVFFIIIGLCTLSGKKGRMKRDVVKFV